MEELCNEVVMFIIKRCSNKPTHSKGVIDRLSFFIRRAEGRLAGLIDQLRHAVHGPIQRPVFPLSTIWCSIFYGRPAPLIDVQLEAGPAFRAETSTADRAIIVSFNVDHLAILHIHTLPAAYSAVWAYALNHPGIMDARFQVFTPFAERVGYGTHMRLNGFHNIARRKPLGQFAQYGCEDSHNLFPSIIYTYLIKRVTIVTLSTTAHLQGGKRLWLSSHPYWANWPNGFLRAIL